MHISKKRIKRNKVNKFRNDQDNTGCVFVKRSYLLLLFQRYRENVNEQTMND